MELKLYIVNIIGGPTILQRFDVSKQDVEECFSSDHFFVFSSYADLNYWQKFFEKENGDFSYILIDITNNCSPDKLKGFLDIKMKGGDDLLKMVQSFNKKTPEVLHLTEKESEEKLDLILSKVGESGMNHLDEEEKEFLKNYK